MTDLPANYWNGPHDCSLAGHRECSQSKELPRNQVAPTGPIVWVLSSGEDYEGGHVLGVYASKDAAKGPFVEAAKKIPFDLDKVWQDDDGAVNAHGGCDWVALEPHPLITATQIAPTFPGGGF